MPTYPTLLYTTKKTIAVGDAVYDNTGTAIPGVTIYSINQDGSFNLAPPPELKLYTITYDETKYTSVTPTMEGARIFSSSAANPNLSTDFAIVENEAIPITFTLTAYTPIGYGSGTGTISYLGGFEDNQAVITPNTLSAIAGMSYTISITNSLGTDYASVIYINGTEVASATGTATYTFTPNADTTIGIGFSIDPA